MREQDAMASTEFRLIYDGEALLDGQMDVADLAPALLGIGQLIQASGRVAYGDNVKVQVQVKTLKEGSFDIWLDVGLRFWPHVRDLLLSPDASAAKNLVEVLLLGAGPVVGLVKLVKWLRGRKPDYIRQIDENHVRIELDGIFIEVTQEVMRLAMNRHVREALERVIAEPLEKEGIDKVVFASSHSKQLEVQKVEAPFFRAPPALDFGEFETTYKKAFSIVSLSFKPGTKWKLSDGHGAAKLVTVLDEGFLAAIERGAIRFGKGDVLICEVREISRQTRTGLKSEYEILRVLEHRSAADNGQSLLDLS